MKLLDNKILVINGGTQGIGGGVARAAVREGATVLVTGRNRERGEAFAKDAGVSFVQADMADAHDARAGVDAAVRAHGRIDCLVNAAGLTTRGSLTETSPKLFDEHVAINLRGPFFAMQAAVQDMLARSAPGTIVNILTTSMHCGQPFLAAYTATKAGLAGATKNAANTHRFDRIRINGLNIGWAETEGEDAIQRQFHGAQDGWAEDAAKKLPMGKLSQPDEIADFVVFLLSNRSGVVTGSIIDWDQNVIGAVD